MPFSIRKASMKQAGMAMPTISPCRTPRLAIISTMTRMVAVIRPDSRTTRPRSMNSLSS
ncbi:hypothetical protein D3C83_318500 [compost metagenome]